MTTGVVQSARVQTASELVNELVRAFKVRRLYDAGHPQRRESEETIGARIAALLDQSGAIEFTIEGDRLLVDGEPVYDQAEGRDSLAFLMYREGLRQLSLYPGLAGEEVGVFLDEVAAAALAHGEEEFDLVARLWERNFVHIRYAFVEQLMDEEWTPAAAEETLVLGRDQNAVVLLDEDKSAADFLREVDSTLYFLDDEDMAALQRELESEKERTLIHETMTCLREVLLVPELDDPAPLLAAIGDIHTSFLEEGSYGDVVTLHEVFAPYLASERAGNVARSAFSELFERALEEEVLQRLAARVDAASVPDDVAAGYYRAFGGPRLASLLRGCGDLKRLCQRPPIAAAFVDVAREDAETLRAAMVDEDPAVACPAVYLAGMLADPMLLEPLGEALQSPDAQVRREALVAVKQIGGPRTLDMVARAIEDADPTVRLYALRHIVLHRYAPALPRVTALLDREVEQSLTERRLLYEAYGALGGEGSLDELGKRLRRRGGVFRKTDPEELACVLIGIGAVGTPKARALVEEATTSRHPLIQRTAHDVLATWDSPRARR